MRRVLSLVLALAGLVLACPAQTNSNQEVRSLSLEDCLQIALEHNLNIQISRFDPEIARYNYRATFGAYDPGLAFSAQHDYNLSPGGVDPQGRTFLGNETETDSFRSGISGLLPWGLNYSFGGSIADTYGTRPAQLTVFNQPLVVTNTFTDLNTGNPISYVSTNYGTVQGRSSFENTSGNLGFLQLRQPLLKNFWIDSTRLQIFLNRSNLRISELELRDQIITAITEVERAYFNLIYAQENVVVQRKALEFAEQLLAENRKRVEVGAMAPLDEKQAQAQAAGTQADLLAAQGTEDTLQRVLKALLSDDYSKWKSVHISPTIALVAVPETFDLQESWRLGLAERPDLRQQRINVEKQTQVVRYQKNQLLPQVDVVGTYGYNGAGREFSDALGQITSTDNPFYSYGAQLTVPLSRTSARNNYKAAKATREQIELQLKQLEQNVLIQIENAISVANTAFQRVQATREARQYAEDALNAEQKKLQSGKSTNFEVLRLQRDLTAARSTEIRALADYNIALADVARNEGSTLERRNVAVELK